MGLPVLRLSSSSTHAVTNTPAEPQAAFRSHSPVTTAFPVLTPGRLPHHPFRGLLSVHSHYGLHGRQVPYKTLYTRGFSRFVTSTAAPVATGRSESCRTGFAPAERQRLGTAHVKLRLDGPEAARDISELRSLLDAFNEAKKTAGLTIVRMLVTGLVMALLAGAFVKLKVFGGGQ